MKYECCSNQSIQTMDYKYPVFGDYDNQITKINRICLKCFAHWFGTEGNIKKYTRQEWDAEMEKSLKD